MLPRISSGLTVRQHQRATIDLRAEFEISERCRDQVRFNPSAQGGKPWLLTGSALDVSPGGLGVRSFLFVPRQCVGTIRLLAPSDRREVVFAQHAIVRRAKLLPGDQSYLLGPAFPEPGPEIAEQVSSLVEVSRTAGGGHA